MQNKSMTNAMLAWKNAIGESAVTAYESLGDDFCTYAIGHSALAKLRPVDVDAVRQCLLIAAEYGVPVYPVSGGRNWGYGSATPTQAAVVLDLSRLNQITDYDQTLGTVSIQPGVTQQQLYDFLQQQGGKFWMDATGSSGACSVLGNTLERGFGHGSYSDHAGQLVCMEIMLADGRLIQTGLGHFRSAKAAGSYAAGLGPGLSQLFLQSNFGLITCITINLMPAPDYFQAFYFSTDRQAEIGPLIDTLRPLRLGGVIRSALHIGNAYRVLSSIQQYPWAAAGGVTPLPESVLEDFGKRWGFSAWNGSAALYGTRRQVAEARRNIKSALGRQVNKLRFMDDDALALIKRLQKPFHWLTGINFPEMLKLIEPVHNMMKGKSTDRLMASTYWRKKMVIPLDMDPDRDRCGLIWCAHVAPTKGHFAKEMTDIVNKILPAHGFEPSMTLTLINERCLDNVVSICYDRDVPGEDQRALACYAELAQTLIAAGYFPYRLGIHAMQLMQHYGGREYLDLLRQLKHLFDPHQIISPGRYVVPGPE